MRPSDRRLALSRQADRHDRRAREVSPALAGLVERTRAPTELPLYAGFGISTPEQARAVAKLADGVVVGSRAVQVAEDGPAALRDYVAQVARRDRRMTTVLVDARNVQRSQWPNVPEDELVERARAWADRHDSELVLVFDGKAPEAGVGAKRLDERTDRRRHRRRERGRLADPRGAWLPGRRGS